MNIILYKNNSDKIEHFIKDCIKKGNNFIGSNKKIYGIKNIEYKWTNDELNPIIIDGEIIGWIESVSDINEELEDGEIKPVTETEYREAIKIRKQIADLTYNQIDNYIENNVTDLPSAKLYLKKLSAVVLSIIKMHDK